MAEDWAVAAERLGAERDHLVRELFLAEQALAEAFDVRCRPEELWAAAAEQQATLARTTSELAVAHAEIACQLEANRRANDQIVAMRSSTSWRITKPLRAVRAVMGRLKSSSQDP